MLLKDKMKDYPFSNTETVIVDFILDKKMAIADYSANAIAKETFTSPSLLVRIAKKLGYSGWSELKDCQIRLQEDYQRPEAGERCV